MARMSNQQRLERMAAEKAAAAREKAAKATKKKATKKKASSSPARKTTKAAAAPARMRIVWVVCNHMGEGVKTFLYPEKDAADAEAARLKEQKNKHFYVERRQVEME